MPDQPTRRDVLPLSPDDLALWRGNLTQAATVRKLVAKWEDANLKRYAPKMSDDPEVYEGDLNTNRDFVLVERKKADLFYQRPDVTCVPSPLLEGHEELLDTDATLLNEKLGLDGVNAKRLVHAVLFQVLCLSGTGWTAMGYENVSIPTQTPDPTWQPPQAPNPLTGAMEPDPTAQAPMVTAQVPVFEDCFWREFSPRQAVVPAEFRSTNWDDAPYLGMRFEMPVRIAKRKGWVPQDYTGQSPDKDTYLDQGMPSSATDAVATGTLLYYKSSIYRDDRPHPQHQTMLVLMDGVDEPAEHKDSPYQTLDARGQLTADSLIGFPIHPLTIRSVTDAQVVPSDCTISRPLVNELNKFREQMVEQREANVMRWMYNTGTLPPEALLKIVRSPLGGFIGVPPEAFVGEGSIKELPHGTIPRENMQFNDYVDNDISRTHAIDAEQSGASEPGDQTATESSIKQNNVNARLGLERGIVLDWYCKGVTKFATLIHRYYTVDQAAAIVGPEQAQAWDRWRKQIPVALAFTALPDSTLRTDVAVEKKRELDQYTFFIKDPQVDHAKYLKRVFNRLHLPQDLILPQPPEQKPEAPKMSIAISGADMDPMMPQYNNVYQILTAQGYQNLTPPQMDPMTASTIQAMQQPQPATNTTHPGKAPQAESLSKHHADRTGAMPGTGQVQPGGQGSMVQ